jgi:O-acetyl-ADP-ribose deacetylase
MSASPTAGTTTIDAIVGDIAMLSMDAIVNAANKSLLGGGGVDGAIHLGAGPELKDECSLLGGCPTGEARITMAYRLPARRIIHTVGPVWMGGRNGEPQVLAACYRNSLLLAIEHEIRSIAFPAISTGAYAYPREQAAQIAVTTVREFVAATSGIEHVCFCCYSKADLTIYRELLA